MKGWRNYTIDITKEEAEWAGFASMFVPVRWFWYRFSGVGRHELHGFNMFRYISPGFFVLDFVDCLLCGYHFV